jgi:hypothetical protein
MIHRNWREPEAYAFCEVLTSAQWAWEFLRRNPEYRRQWRAFNETWQALEAAYGRPPHRDFCAWKNDPRAWVPASECPGGECRIDGERVLIECALGARWGFHKFPPDPADDDPVGEGRLNWRKGEEVPLPVVEGRSPHLAEQPEMLALLFDLSLPLKPQLEQARRQLQMAAARRRRQGRLVPKRVATLRPRWKQLLRLLDAEAAGELDEARQVLDVEGKLLEEARALVAGGYLELVRIPR